MGLIWNKSTKNHDLELFSQLSSNKYDVEKCIKKQESFKYDHDASDMIYFLKKHGIEINDLECSTIFINDDAMNDKEFDKFRFTQNMIKYEPFPDIKPEYIPFVINT